MYLKRWLLFSLLCVSTFSMQAQSVYKDSLKFNLPPLHSNSIEVYYGYFSNQQFFGVLVGIWAEAFSSIGDENIINDIKAPGVFGISYNKHLKRRLSIGADYNYAYLNYRIVDSISLDFKYKDAYNFHELKFNLGVDYYKKNKVTLYGGIGIGVSLLNLRQIDEKKDILDKATQIIPIPTWHINLLGVEVGKKVSGFVELGIGNRGILNAGIKTHF